jgi:hypothetical protein
MELVHRAQRLTGLLGLVGAAAAARIWGWQAAVGVIGGVGWVLANVWAIGALVRTACGPQRRRGWKLVGLFALKLPVLYALGACLLLGAWSSPVGCVAGLSVWFVALGLIACRVRTV